MLKTKLNGGREAERAVGERSEAATAPTAPAQAPDPELVERPRRRRYTAEYKLRILREADTCAKPGDVGALLRRHPFPAEGVLAIQRTSLRVLQLRRRPRNPRGRI